MPYGLQQSTPAQLFRLTGVQGQTRPIIGPHATGTAREMVQLAMNNSDDLWRYSILADVGPSIIGDGFRSLAAA